MTVVRDEEAVNNLKVLHILLVFSFKERFIFYLFKFCIRRAKFKKKAQPDDWSGLDVYFLGMDSLSQMTYRRKLPKTVKYLEEVMGSVVLNGW